jgi:integrase
VDRTRYLYRKTIKGRRYLFFRHKGRLTRLPPDQETAEFRAAYDAALRAAKRVRSALKKRQVRPAGQKTVSAAIDTYLNSVAFDALARSTRAQYQRTSKDLRTRLGKLNLDALDTDAIDIYTEQLAQRRGNSVADSHLRLISNVWRACRKYPQFNLKGKLNPTLNAERFYTVQRRYRPWPRDVQQTFMSGARDNVKLAKLLLHFSAQRGCDCIAMRWTDYDGIGISVRQRKTYGDVDPLPNYYKCPKPLREALDREMHSGKPLAETILVNERGRPYASASVLSHAIKRELVRLGLAKHGERSWVMHGLRKTAASEVGSLAVGAAGVKSIGGWRTDGEANYYAQHADQRRINAIVVEQWDAELERQWDAELERH